MSYELREYDETPLFIMPHHLSWNWTIHSQNDRLLHGIATNNKCLYVNRYQGKELVILGLYAQI